MVGQRQDSATATERVYYKLHRWAQAADPAKHGSHGVNAHAVGVHLPATWKHIRQVARQGGYNFAASICSNTCTTLCPELFYVRSRNEAKEVREAGRGSTLLRIQHLWIQHDFVPQQHGAACLRCLQKQTCLIHPTALVDKVRLLEDS
eukprot:CAMPEP_0172724896 /NCGR_PEP_ID=MMETSP1074-20121228/87112_1 /TAXON_ID=2916 /ORGANISM="Ceratium fusus, Strain PA161109" /LENGTH=147 /DNA_ID=CAMNT_0013551519 /DNA_START=166 /DNA_END=609 /DNA_ORIENTATION=+